MRRSPHLASVSGVLALALVAAACSTDSTPAEPAPETRDVGTATSPVTEPAPSVEYSIDWEPLSPSAASTGHGTDHIDWGWITVPLDYDDPAGPTVDLRIARRQADPDERIGVLFSNNGGPGAPASTIALNATAWFDASITDRFDVVSWDPRGTGQSDGVDCIDDDEYDRYFGSADITPETDAERADLVDLARDFAAACVERAGDILQHIGTNNSARDMDAIRQALDEAQASYFGFSYGSELGGAWTTLFPTTVRAAIFDGAADPDADPIEQERQQRIGFENALATFLSECSADSDCDFHNGGDAEGAFDELWTSLDETPVASAGGRAAVNLGIATTAVVQSMYSERFWGALEGALRDATNGDGAALLQLRDAYFQRSPGGEYSDLIEAFQAISCADQAERPTPAEDDEQARQLTDVAPRLFPQTTGSYFCTFFPPALDPRVEITGAGAGPIMVVGTTGDPSTPLASSRRMADSLEDGRLVIVEANQHTGYGVNQCIMDVADDYLIHLDAPEDGTVCA
jgi:pimeloyl-ACP methyl ester carboxylesterase